MDKNLLHKQFISICSESQDHHGMGINSDKFVNWYNSLNDCDKEIFESLMIENLNDYYFICCSNHINSKKIQEYVIKLFKDVLKNKNYKDLMPHHFSILSHYKNTDDIKKIALSLLEERDKLGTVIKWRPLKLICEKYPETIESVLPTLKEIYYHPNLAAIIPVYDGLISFYKGDFPNVFLQASKNLTNEESETILNKFPFIFSGGKYDDIKEEIYTKLEQLLHRNLSRKLTS